RKREPWKAAACTTAPVRYPVSSRRMTDDAQPVPCLATAGRGPGLARAVREGDSFLTFPGKEEIHHVLASRPFLFF
ncbi:hypothetical protein CSUI_009279, partial [Cystoisospora suis]